MAMKRSINITDAESNIILKLIQFKKSIIEYIKVCIVTNVLLKLNSSIILINCLNKIFFTTDWLNCEQNKKRCMEKY